MISIPEPKPTVPGDPPLFAVEGLRLSDATVRQIANLVEQGALPPGSRLPSERELLKRLCVGRTSVREALRILEGLGLVVVKPGVGAFVADRSKSGQTTTKWAEWLSEHKFEVMELLEVREALEPKAAVLAAERRTEAELDAISRVLEHMRRGIEDHDISKLVTADIDFHNQIARASKNRFLIMLSENMSHALGEHRYAYFSLPRKAIVSFRAHKRIADAIYNREARKAFIEMLRHIQHSKANIGRLGNARSDQG